MNIFQTIAAIMTRLLEAGLSEDQVKTATSSILPAILEVGGGEREINLSCNLFIEKMKNG